MVDEWLVMGRLLMMNDGQLWVIVSNNSGHSIYHVRVHGREVMNDRLNVKWSLV